MPAGKRKHRQRRRRQRKCLLERSFRNRDEEISFVLDKTEVVAHVLGNGSFRTNSFPGSLEDGCELQLTNGALSKSAFIEGDQIEIEQDLLLITSSIHGQSFSISTPKKGTISIHTTADNLSNLCNSVIFDDCDILSDHSLPQSGRKPGSFVTCSNDVQDSGHEDTADFVVSTSQPEPVQVANPDQQVDTADTLSPDAPEVTQPLAMYSWGAVIPKFIYFISERVFDFFSAIQNIFYRFKSAQKDKKEKEICLQPWKPSSEDRQLEILHRLDDILRSVRRLEAQQDEIMDRIEDVERNFRDVKMRPIGLSAPPPPPPPPPPPMPMATTPLSSLPKANSTVAPKTKVPVGPSRPSISLQDILSVRLRKTPKTVERTPLATTGRGPLVSVDMLRSVKLRPSVLRRRSIERPLQSPYSVFMTRSP